MSDAPDTTSPPDDDEQVAPAPKVAPQLADDELGRVTAERDDYLDALQRLKADFDNYRKRTERERLLLAEAGVRDLVADLLPVLDNLERALEALVAAGDVAAAGIVAGVEMVRSHLAALIVGRGVQEIPAHGETFDPNVHEAVQRMPSPEHPEGVVMAVVERGYRMSDVVIRPAKVVVSGGPGQGVTG